MPITVTTALLAQWFRCPPQERKISGSNPTCIRIFPGSSHTCVSKIGTPVATLPGIIGSVLGLVDPLSVYCDWVRWKVWSATSISVWQHVTLSEQIRPWDTLVCCWDVKQLTNKHHHQNSCSPQLLQVAIELLPQWYRFWPHVLPQSITQLAVL